MASFLENALARLEKKAGEQKPPTPVTADNTDALRDRIQKALMKTEGVENTTPKVTPETMSNNSDKELNLESLATKKAEVLAEIANIKTEYPMAASSELAQKLSSLEESFRTAKAQERYAKYIPNYKTGDEDLWTQKNIIVNITPKIPNKTRAEIAEEENKLIEIKIAEIENNPELKNEVLTAIARSKEYNSKIKTLESKTNAYNDTLRELSLNAGDSKMVPIAENLRRIHGGATERIQEGQKLQKEKITLGRVGSDPFALGKQVYEHFNKI